MERVNFVVMDRIALALGTRTRIELCEKTKIPLGTYDTWRWKNYIPKMAIIKIAHDHRLNPNWIITGEGNRTCGCQETKTGEEV